MVVSTTLSESVTVMVSYQSPGAVVLGTVTYPPELIVAPEPLLVIAKVSGGVPPETTKREDVSACPVVVMIFEPPVIPIASLTVIFTLYWKVAPRESATFITTV